MKSLNLNQKSLLKTRILSRITVVNTGCWEYPGAFIDKNGRHFYPTIHIPFTKLACSVHRVSYTVLVTDIPKGKWVLHKCDNTRCVNPDHLYIGTYRDNTRDMVLRGRGNGGPRFWKSTPKINHSGIHNGRAKLTEKQIMDIRKKYKSGKVSCRYLGRKYGVHNGTISKIVRKLSWTKLK